jgi:hypothetical protein
MLPYDRRMAGAAHFHAKNMVTYSPDNCSNTGYVYNATDCLPNKSQGLFSVCCFRQEDCDNCTRGPDYRIIDFGYVWNKTASAGGGYGEGIAANTPPELIAQAVAGIACDPPDLSQPDVCSPKDNSNLNRQAIFGPRDAGGKLFEFFGGGGGYASGGKEEHYWVFDTALGPNNDNSFKTPRYPIASASFVGFNTTFGGWMVNYDNSPTSPSAGRVPLDVIVAVSGTTTAQTLSKIGSKLNYFSQASAPSSCVAFAFGVKTANAIYRYPESGNVQWGCTTDYAADSLSCGSCSNGICLQNQCYSFSNNVTPASASSMAISFLAIVLAVVFAMMF